MYNQFQWNISQKCMEEIETIKNKLYGLLYLL